MKRMKKKGSIIDNFWVMVQFFAAALFLLAMFKVWGAFTSDEMNDDIWTQSSVGVGIRNNAQTAFDNWDWIFVVVYFGLHLGIIVMAFMLRSHPVVYVAGILLIVVLVMISVPLANAWDDISKDDEFSTEITNMPKVDYILENLPKFEMVWAFVSLIVFASLSKSEGMW